MWHFDIAPDAAVVTSKYITQDNQPILYVTHEDAGEDGIIWQFHCDNEDYSNEVLQLVRLDEILEIDPGVYDLADLPVGFCARRDAKGDRWVRQRE